MAGTPAEFLWDSVFKAVCFPSFDAGDSILTNEHYIASLSFPLLFIAYGEAAFGQYLLTYKASDSIYY